LNTLGLLILISPGVSGIFETSIPVSGQTNLTLTFGKGTPTHPYF